MDTKEVTSKEFENIMKKKLIPLGVCRSCGTPGGQLIINLPWYGTSVGAYAICPACGYKTKTHPIHIQIRNNEAKRYASPITEKSLIDGVKKTINEWNGMFEGRG